MTVAKSFFAVSFATATLFVLLEGIASTGITGVKLVGRVWREKIYTQYDPELGWIVLPNLYIEDMYGDGIFLRTNAQHFRHANEVEKNTPKGKVRIVCSGDSFTFGYGVDNDHTWCSLLAAKNERLEAINIGQNGYGIGQSFLFYNRIQEELDHQVHVFTFITDDFRRAATDRFLGYPKPMLALRDGNLIVENTPVPKRLFYSPHLIVAAETLNELRLVDLTRRLVGSTGRSASAPKQYEIDVAQTRKIVIKVFQELQQISETNRSQIVLVYLPAGEWDYRSQDPVTESWRKFLESEARKHEWLFLDLVTDFSQLDENSIGNLYDGHYSVSGNKYVAERLYERLMSVPKIAELVSHGK